MASRLRNKTARVSFFAFQDMITTVTGVLMIVMLLLALDIGRRTSSPNASAQAAVKEQLRQAEERLALNLETLRRRQGELNARSNRVFVIPDTDRSGKQPVLVVVSGAGGACSRLGQTNLTEFSGGARRTDFAKLLNRWNASQDRVVFYVRPSGVDHYKKCRELAKERGFTVGSDTAEEDKQYVLAAP